MNKMKRFKSIAASTLLLSVFASTSVFANPKTTQLLSSGPVVKVERTDIKSDAVATVQSFMLPDPIELAREYAPDTAEDWEAIIKQYHELMKDKFSISIVEADLIQIQSTATTKPASSAGGISATDIKLDVIEELDGAPLTVTAAAKPAPMFEVHSKLAKAAEDKDAAGIRDALAELLVQYKEEIKQLQAEDN
ncbi:hypothetical protein D3P07_05685 [Paenibacillus sp. 1011MAR3C5]|uniref:hypothetical protein n=1 Tax=Paenibacillus sp. 1011MAR3C5 TaxID=1675787 RepID=UPI000E6CB7A7|nr:hypothetical protein [Paenibacillus sp. 1011MAR3C5]RJE89722.1 hypothetical protein D3P07_05685 [Paenibacillus sp. 1011MAR3C5]